MCCTTEYVVSGQTWSNNGDARGNHGASDFWILRIDSIGTLLWQTCLGGSDGEEGCRIARTFDGGYICTGLTYSNDGQVTGRIRQNGMYDFWIVKLDTVGRIEWENTFGGSADEWPSALIQTSDSGYSVVQHIGNYCV
jgi:hypothetical protein